MISKTRLFTTLLFLAFGISLFFVSAKNNRLATEVKQFQAELGKMSIDNADQVYVTEIESVDIPPEVAPQVQRVWQFRVLLTCGLRFPPFSWRGRVTENGIYHDGGYGSTHGSIPTNATHTLMTVSLQKQGEQLLVHYSFAGSAGTHSWNGADLSRIDQFVVQKLVSSRQGPRVFNQDTILPILKIYDPSTANEKATKNEKLTTFEGFIVLLSPKSRESVMNQLRKGEIPSGFEPSWLAKEARDE